MAVSAVRTDASTALARRGTTRCNSGGARAVLIGGALRLGGPPWPATRARRRRRRRRPVRRLAPVRRPRRGHGAGNGEPRPRRPPRDRVVGHPEVTDPTRGLTVDDNTKASAVHLRAMSGPGVAAQVATSNVSIFTAAPATATAGVATSPAHYDAVVAVGTNAAAAASAGAVRDCAAGARGGVPRRCSIRTRSRPSCATSTAGSVLDAHRRGGGTRRRRLADLLHRSPGKSEPTGRVPTPSTRP